MAYIPRSSIINPQAPSAIPTQVKRRHTIRIFNLITSMLFVAALIGTVGVFLYLNILKGQLATAREALDTISSVDNSKKIEEIRVYDYKLNIAHTLLDNHMAPSLLLSEIEGSTKETIQFMKFEYAYDPGFDVVLTLGGNTEELSSIALQKMQILKDGLFANFELSDITTKESLDVLTPSTPAIKNGENEGVDFSIKGVFRKDVLKFVGTDSVEQAQADDISETTSGLVDDGTVPPVENATLIPDTI